MKFQRDNFFILINEVFRQNSTADILLGVFPLIWSVGIKDFLSAAINGATLLLSSNQFHAKEALSLIGKYKVTKLLLVPVYAAQMLSCEEMQTADLSSVKLIEITGAKLTADLRSRLKRFFSASCTIRTTYGCSEMSGIAYEVESSSFALNPNIETRIICPETGQFKSMTEEGEIVVRHRTFWLGYLNDDNSTRMVYENGWYKTGDLGYFDANRNLHINSRIKDIINLEPFDISPLEIEEEIEKIPDVTLAVVVGIPDELKWNLLAVLVIRQPNSTVTEQDVIERISSRKPSYQHINGGVYFVEKVPTTSNGKILRRYATQKAIIMFNERNHHSM